MYVTFGECKVEKQEKRSDKSKSNKINVDYEWKSMLNLYYLWRMSDEAQRAINHISNCYCL